MTCVQRFFDWGEAAVASILEDCDDLLAGDRRLLAALYRLVGQTAPSETYWKGNQTVLSRLTGVPRTSIVRTLSRLSRLVTSETCGRVCTWQTRGSGPAAVLELLIDWTAIRSIRNREQRVERLRRGADDDSETRSDTHHDTTRRYRDDDRVATSTPAPSRHNGRGPDSPSPPSVVVQVLEPRTVTPRRLVAVPSAGRASHDPGKSRNPSARTLNRCPEWRSLTDRDFAAWPLPLDRLTACLHVLRRLGALGESRDEELHWWATVHDVRSAQRPAAALVWRAGLGDWHRASQASYDWARQMLTRRAPAEHNERHDLPERMERMERMERRGGGSRSLRELLAQYHHEGPEL